MCKRCWHAKLNFCATWCAETHELNLLKRCLTTSQVWLTRAAVPHRGASPCPAERPAVYKSRPNVEEATRAWWRSRTPPPKGAPCAGLDSHPRLQPGLARGCAPRRARPGAERAPAAAGDPVAGGRGLRHEVAYELPAVANVSAPVPIGAALAEIAEIPFGVHPVSETASIQMSAETSETSETSQTAAAVLALRKGGSGSQALLRHLAQLAALDLEAVG
jgi:hypothetical protein